MIRLIICDTLHQINAYIKQNEIMPKDILALHKDSEGIQLYFKGGRINEI